MHILAALATTAFKCNLCIPALRAVQPWVMPVSSKSIGTLQLTWKLPRHWSYALSMLTWSFRQAAITAQVMHSRLSAGAIIQGWRNRNTGPVIWTEILHSCSFFIVLLLNMCMPSWGLPAKYSYLLSLPLHPRWRVCNVLHGATSGNISEDLWALVIWRRLETQVIPSRSTALMSLVYHKKCHQHSYQP